MTFKLFGKYRIRLIRYPILIIGSIYSIENNDFEKLKKYCWYITKIRPKIVKDDELDYPVISIRMETIYIFEFKSVTHYRRFLKQYLNKDICIKISNLKEIEIKNIDKIILDGNGIIKVKLESGTEFRIPIISIYKMLELLYEKRSIDITMFDKYLHEQKILPKEKSFLDKRQQSIYMSYWYGPYRILQQYSIETGNIIVEKPYKNQSIIKLTMNKNMSLEELKNDLHKWLLSKINKEVI